MYQNNVLSASFYQGAHSYRLVGRRAPSQLRSAYYQTVALMNKFGSYRSNRTRLGPFERVKELLASADAEVSTAPRAAAQKIQRATRMLGNIIYKPKRCRRCSSGEVCLLNNCVSGCYPPCAAYRTCLSGGVCSRSRARYSDVSRSYRGRGRYRRKGCMCRGHSGDLPSSGGWALVLCAVLLFVWRRRQSQSA